MPHDTTEYTDQNAELETEDFYRIRAYVVAPDLSASPEEWSEDSPEKTIKVYSRYSGTVSAAISTSESDVTDEDAGCRLALCKS